MVESWEEEDNLIIQHLIFTFFDAPTHEVTK